MTNGTVRSFDAESGFGFIQPDDGGKDAFIHISAIRQTGAESLTPGQKVSYTLETGSSGKSTAVDLNTVNQAQS